MARLVRGGAITSPAGTVVGLVVVSLALALSACSSGPGPSAASIPPGATQALVSPVVSSAEPTPAGTPVPGYEDWSTINAEAVRITRAGDALVLELVGSVLWFEAEQGVLFHTEVTGSFRAIATVRTAAASDADAPPGRDGTIQLAGLMARTDATEPENSVFVAAGSLGESTGVETRSTTDDVSYSTQTTTSGLGDADLRLCREGDTLRTAFRPAGSSGAWVPISTWDRPDMPDALQVGASISTNATPDLVARFEGLAIEPLGAGEAC